MLIELSRGPTTSNQIQNAVESIKDILGNTRNLSRTGGYFNSSGQEGLGGSGSIDRSGSKSKQDPPSWYKKLVDKKK